MSIQNFNQNASAYSGSIRKKDFYDDYIQRIVQIKASNVMELGCASGDFLYHLPSDINGIGIDKSEELIDVANKTRIKDNLSFYCEDFLGSTFKRSADVVVMTGFLCTFMSFEEILLKALSSAKKLVLINDFLNPYGVDAKFTLRCKDHFPQTFETIYSVWSTATMSCFLDGLSLKYRFEPYNMYTTLNEIPVPVRNYHANLDGERVVVNRAGMILRGYNMIIEK